MAMAMASSSAHQYSTRLRCPPLASFKPNPIHFAPQLPSKVIGASVYVNGKGRALLPIEAATIHHLTSVEDGGITETEDDYSSFLSFNKIQYNHAFERCRQLQDENVSVKGRIVGANKGVFFVMVEGLRCFVPLKDMPMNAMTEELLGKEIPLKIVEVDEGRLRIILTHLKRISDSPEQLGIGSVVTGTVRCIKSYGAFIDIGGITGLLHVSQISHNRVSDINTVLQIGDTLKVMILSIENNRDRVSLSTKKLEPSPGDMILNRSLVFEKAEEMAQKYMQRRALAESVARGEATLSV